MLKLVAFVNAFAALIHLLFWGAAFSHFKADIASGAISEALATTLGIGIADIVWSVPLLLIGSIGLLRKWPQAWLSAQMANGLYFYSMTFILIRDGITGLIKPGTLVFLPFTLFAFAATWLLWQRRAAFGLGSSSRPL